MTHATLPASTHCQGVVPRMIRWLGTVLLATPLSVVGSDSAPEPIAAEALSQSFELTDPVDIEIRLQPEGRDELVLDLADPSQVTVRRFTIQPGAVFPWHTHPGPVLAGVEQGKLVYIYADDCVERPYPTGTMFVDPGGDNVHTAYNPSASEETVVVATFLNAPADGALTLPVDADESAALDERCDIERPAASAPLREERS